MDSLKVIFFGIAFNLLIVTSLMATGATNHTSEDVLTFLGGYYEPITTGTDSASNQIKDIKEGGWTQIQSNINNVLGQITNLAEGFLNIVKFMIIGFTLIFASVFTPLSIAIDTPNAIVRLISMGLSLISALVIFNTGFEFYRIFILRKVN